MEAALPNRDAGSAASAPQAMDPGQRRAFILGLLALVLVAALPVLPVNNYIVAATVRE